jgi:hypothetical protein
MDCADARARNFGPKAHFFSVHTDCSMMNCSSAEPALYRGAVVRTSGLDNAAKTSFCLVVYDQLAWYFNGWLETTPLEVN